jgi:hypothetical protein
MTETSIVHPYSWDGIPRATGQREVVVVPPSPWEGARVGKCYLNVREMVRRHGGEFAYGWALTDRGPHRIGSGSEPPLYRRWLNHVVWRNAQGQLREVSPNAVIDNFSKQEFRATEFLVEPEATFEIVSDEEWFTQPTRYVPLRPEGTLVAELLTKAQHAIGDVARNEWLGRALSALQLAGFRPREWKVETLGERTGSIWLIAE